MDQIIPSRKTKFVSRLMIISGILMFLTWVFDVVFITIYGLPHINTYYYVPIDFWLSLIFNYRLLSIILFLALPWFLLKGKKWAWWVTTVILLREAVAAIYILCSTFMNFSYEILLLKSLPTVIPSWHWFYGFIISMALSVIFYILVIISVVSLYKNRKIYLS